MHNGSGVENVNFAHFDPTGYFVLHLRKTQLG